jgi:ABC-type nitrate/sulfonate/bicarbonate transport system ATPase subunit
MKVRIRALGFAYGGVDSGTLVLSHLDLDVHSGSVHAIVGPNGCGKSTLLRIVAGLEKPMVGSVEFIGPQRHENKTALVFQNPRLLPWWNVERNIAISAEFSEKPDEMYKKIRDFHTKRMGLARVRTQRPDTLSLGQQTMAGLGRGIAHDAEVLLLDEPFAHLDALNRRKLHEEFETHWQMDPRTILLVTHDVDEAIMLSDRVSVMRHGPGPFVDTIEVDAERPRVGISPVHPGLRSATTWVWDALEKSRP